MIQPTIGLSMLHRLGDPFDEGIKDVLKRDIKFIEVVDEGLHALNKRRVSKLLDLSKSYDLKFSVHAPYADINIASPSKSILRAMVKRLLASLVNAHFLEARLWILHPGIETGVSMFYPNFCWTQNIKTVELLCKAAKDYGVNVAIENLPEPYPFLMKSVEHFQKFYEDFKADYNLGLVLDVGHANLNGQIELFMEKFSDKLVHIHAHDNDGKEDLHLGIGRGTVNWKSFAETLEKISYSGAVVVESTEHVTESLHELEKLLL